MNRPLAAALAASAMVLAGATPALASARPAVVHHPKVSAETLMTNRPDSGGNGDWAHDQFTRKVTIEQQTPTATINCSTTATQCFEIAGANFPTNRGGLCEKGLSAAELLSHPDRLTTPLVRDARNDGAPTQVGLESRMSPSTLLRTRKVPLPSVLISLLRSPRR